MESSKIKAEVENFGDLKVKLEENLFSAVYEVEVTSNVDIKLKEEHLPQSSPTLVTKEEMQSVIYIAVKPDRDPTSDELELKPESTTSNGESELKSEDDSNQEHTQTITPSSLASSTRSIRNICKRKKRAVRIQRSQLLQCALCQHNFTKVELLITHARNEHAKLKNPSADPMSDDEDENALQCPLCSKFFTSVHNLHKHFLRFHNKNKPFQCSVCLESRNEIKKFPTEACLLQHIKMVHDTARYKFQCNICSHKFPTSSRYKFHKRKHMDKQYKCEYCSKTYRDKEGMLKHIIAVHKEYTDRHETFKCVECEQLFCSQKDLDGHVLQTHVAETVECKICFKKFREEGTLNQHLDFAHWEHRTTLVCDVCSKVFKNNQELVKHLEVQHKRFFKCRKCFRSFVSKEEHDSHFTEILDEEGRNTEKPQLQCKVCLVFLNTECSFNSHKDTHGNPSEIERKIITRLNPDNPQDCFMKCNFCPKTFVQKSLLLDHATQCHPNRKWECKFCDKSFQVKFELNKHELLHSTKKLFECQLCHKGFANLHWLKAHEGIHKIDKKFKCSECEKSFTLGSNLKQHMANHHGGAKPFKCDICQKAFLFKHDLVSHFAVHTNERPFSCSKCSFSSKRANHLKKHQRRMHAENSSAGYKKPQSEPVYPGPHSKYFKNLIFVCCMEKCDFETKKEKEVAIHYAKHKLPTVVLPRLLHGPSSQVFLSKPTPTNKHAIKARYKCTQCYKAFSWQSGLRQHMGIHPNGKK